MKHVFHGVGSGRHPDTLTDTEGNATGQARLVGALANNDEISIAVVGDIILPVGRVRNPVTR